MSVTTIYGNTADGGMYSRNDVYATAQAGSSLVVNTTSTSNDVGQSRSSVSPYFSINERFESFDTSGVGTVTAVTLSLYGKSDSTVQDFTCEARLRDWGATLTTADWVATTSLSSLTRLATFATSGLSISSYNDFTEDGTNFINNINTVGSTRMIIVSSRVVAGNVPSTLTNEWCSFWTSDQTGTSQDPKLVVTDTRVLPTVTTTKVTDLLVPVAKSGGNVTDDGNATITERGVCWGTSSNPTTANSKQTAAGTEGSYTADLSSLSSNTLYYVRAYAINSVGTAYGENVLVDTHLSSVPYTLGGSYLGETFVGTGALPVSGGKIKVKVSAAFVEKTPKIKISGSFDTKPVKVKQAGNWVDI